MLNKQWILKEENSQEINSLAEKLKVSRLVAAILANRRQLVDSFVNKSEAEGLFLHDPFLLKDMKKAVDRINAALENKEKITIYGDFDADGVTGTAVLYMYLKSRGADVDFYIPDRMEEGYGIHRPALDRIKDRGTSLIITVDTGVTAVDNINAAKELGMDVIVTDHHEPKEILPGCVAIIDPKQQECEYPFKELAGVGVVFKLIQAFEGINDELVQSYMPLVCLGTIADVVPLVGENRIFVKIGLDFFGKSQNAGIKALLSATNFQDKQVTSANVGFIIAPRINAAGRLGSAHKSVEMFLCDDCDKAREIAAQLSEENKNRQAMETEIYAQAISIIEKQGLGNDRVIVVENEGWHQGVIGIVSSKITERYYKPSILISVDNDGSKGSGRSIRGFNLFDALNACRGHLIKFGGHSMAAGLSIEKGNIAAFRKEINEYAKGNMKPVDFVPQIFIDAMLQPQDISFQTIDDVKCLEPFGMGNPTPIFMIAGARVNLITAVTEGRHLRMQISKGGVTLNAIGFAMGDLAGDYKIGDCVDLAGCLDVNVYKGERNLQLLLKAIRKSGGK